MTLPCVKYTNQAVQNITVIILWMTKKKDLDAENSQTTQG